MLSLISRLFYLLYSLDSDRSQKKMKITFGIIICVLVCAIKVSSQAVGPLCVDCNVGGLRGTFYGDASIPRPYPNNAAPFVPQPHPYNTNFPPENQPYYNDPLYPQQSQPYSPYPYRPGCVCVGATCNNCYVG